MFLSFIAFLEMDKIQGKSNFELSLSFTLSRFNHIHTHMVVSKKKKKTSKAHVSDVHDQLIIIAPSKLQYLKVS